MKYLIMFVFSLSISGKAFGQFNTISKSPNHYKVQTVKEESKVSSVLSQVQNDSTPSVTNVTDSVQDVSSNKGKSIGMDVDSIRQSLIQQYLSVAYPLRNIKVTSKYGMRRHPILRRRMMHQGIDLRAKYEEVYSMMDGKVIAVASDDRSGRYVSIRYPGGYICSYCHLSQPLVKKGDSIRAGEMIGISGNTGMSTSAHLHLGVKNASGEFVDPLVLLDFIRQIRENVVKELHRLDSKTF